MKSLHEQIESVRREIALRERVYERWVANKKMSQHKADFELDCMRSVLATLEALPKEQRDLGL